MDPSLKLKASAGEKVLAKSIVIKEENEGKSGNSSDPFNGMKQRFICFKQDKFLKNLEHFEVLAKSQTPKFVVIACADSRVCPSIILGFEPGEAFILRNVANLVPPFEKGTSETNAALEFAVNALEVENILVIGHSCCGGIRALMSMDDKADSSFTEKESRKMMNDMIFGRARVPKSIGRPGKLHCRPAPFHWASLFMSTIHVSSAARHLLQVQPTLPRPTLPTIPGLPTLPTIPGIPTLPTIPGLPNPVFPLPTLPFPGARLPPLPMFPSIPQLPFPNLFPPLTASLLVPQVIVPPLSPASSPNVPAGAAVTPAYTSNEPIYRSFAFKMMRLTNSWVPMVIYMYGVYLCSRGYRELGCLVIYRLI